MRVLLALAATLAVTTLGCQFTEADFTAQQGETIPRFEVDPLWPHQLPNQWIIGSQDPALRLRDVLPHSY
jgi:hypothetical protein